MEDFWLQCSCELHTYYLKSVNVFPNILNFSCCCVTSQLTVLVGCIIQTDCTLVFLCIEQKSSFSRIGFFASTIAMSSNGEITPMLILDVLRLSLS